MASVSCGKPTPDGPCRRPVTDPGGPCGVTHAHQAAGPAAAAVPASGPGVDPFAAGGDEPAVGEQDRWASLAGELAAAGVPEPRARSIIELVEREARAAVAGEQSPAAADKAILDKFERWYSGSEQDEEWSMDFNFTVTEQVAEDLARTGRSSGWSKASPDVLRRLREEGEEDDESLAGHPNCPPELWQEFAASGDSGVREAVAGNRSAPPEVLRALAVDADEDVRTAARANPSLPELTDAEVAHAGLLTD